MVHDRRMPGPYTDLDLSVNWLFGNVDRPPRAPIAPGSTPRTVYEEVLLEHLLRGPVGVTFSGGRETGMILATALHVARRHGLPDPIPLSLVFGTADTARDEEAQAAAVAQLGLADRWQRIDVEGQAELVGPLARAGLARHGLLYVPQCYWIRPMAERLSQMAGPGASLLVGHGLSELFGYWKFGKLVDFARRRVRPRRRDLRLLRETLTPFRIREAARRRAYAEAELPWLRAGVTARLAMRTEPPPRLRWDRTVRFLMDRRCEVETARGYAVHCDEFGVRVAFPTLDDRHEMALMGIGRRGPGNLNDYLVDQWGDILPPASASRRDQATYSQVFFGKEVREFARGWSGQGLPEDLVDPAVLRQMWVSGSSDWRTAALLQAAWLHDHEAGRC